MAKTPQLNPQRVIKGAKYTGTTTANCSSAVGNKTYGAVKPKMPPRVGGDVQGMGPKVQPAHTYMGKAKKV